MSLTAGRIGLAALVVAGAHLTTVVPAHAQAEGHLCSFWAATDPLGEHDIYTGEIHGGPAVAASVDPNAPSADPTASITVRCVIQVGPIGATHAGPNAASAQASGTGVVVMPSTPISFFAPSGADVFLCPEVNLNGTTYYWDAVNKTFSRSSSVSCQLAIFTEVERHGEVTGEVVMLVDLILCPLLAWVFPSEGDIPGVWDCPPYNVGATSEHDTGVWFACVTVRGPVCI